MNNYELKYALGYKFYRQMKAYKDEKVWLIVAYVLSVSDRTFDFFSYNAKFFIEFERLTQDLEKGVYELFNIDNRHYILCP